MKHKSILLPIRNYILNECKDFDTAKQTILTQLNKSEVQSADIKRMRVQVEYEIKSLQRLQFWLSNNIMAHEGMKVNG